MNKKLQDHLESFKEYTMEMISSLKNDDMNNFEVVLQRRTQTIDEISKLDFSGTEFRGICEELNLINIDSELNKLIDDEKNKLKEKMLEIKKSQSANNAYHSYLSNSNIFSKKV